MKKVLLSLTILAALVTSVVALNGCNKSSSAAKFTITGAGQ